MLRGGSEVDERCTGHCCRVVSLPVPVKWIQMMVPYDEDPDQIIVCDYSYERDGERRAMTIPREDAETLSACLTPIFHCEPEPQPWSGLIYPYTYNGPKNLDRHLR